MKREKCTDFNGLLQAGKTGVISSFASLLDVFLRAGRPAIGAVAPRLSFNHQFADGPDSGPIGFLVAGVVYPADQTQDLGGGESADE